MKSKLGLITMISTLFWYWKHVELAKIRRFRCKTLKLFFSKQAQDSYYHGILAATALYWVELSIRLNLWKIVEWKSTHDKQFHFTQSN